MQVITIDAYEIMNSFTNTNDALIDIAARKGLPVLPIMRVVDWDRVEKLEYFYDFRAEKYVIEWLPKEKASK